MKPNAILTLVLLFLASVASAQMMRPPSSMPGHGGMGPADGMGPIDLAVAADGTAITIDRNDANDKVVAFTASGTKAWTYTFENAVARRVLLVGTQAVVATDTELVSLNVSNGAKAWSLTLDGTAMQVETGANQIYAIVAKHPNTPQRGRFTAMTRTLIAVSNNGTVLWSYALGQ